METMRIELLNPKARQLLMDLVDLNLIKISSPTFSRQKFIDLLREIRQDDVPSLNEIQEEVKAVRKQMNSLK